MIFFISLLLNVYITPYSLHSFIYADYSEFDRLPSAQGDVPIQRTRIDFRLPAFTLSSQSTQSIQKELQSFSNKENDFRHAKAVVDLVRSRLNAVDENLPRPDYRNAGEIFDQGPNRYCQCGEHARLFVEIAQLRGLQARMIWLEGHVAAEYQDRQRRQWVYIDPHLGVAATDGKGQWLSTAEMIHRLERNRTVEFSVISPAKHKALDFKQFTQDKPYWYRNILLNGEARAYSGSTLLESGRWNHIVRHGRRPQVLVLKSPFDTSPGKFIERCRQERFSSHSSC